MGAEELPKRAIQQAVLRWYAKQARHLSWRQAPADPYQVLVREVMLQQTQAARVERALPAFLERFPSMEALAAAPLAEVLRAWQGLGYNRRARLLWECARMVVQHYGGHLPAEPRLLQQLPGIGAYTAAALATFAFGRQDVPVVDTNVRRVLQRLWGEGEQPLRVVAERARAWIPRGASAQWHQALMDIGALYCRRLPRCAQCPLRRWCRSAEAVRWERSSPRRWEPSFGGIPRRLWRGRLLRLVATMGSLTVPQATRHLFGARPTAQQQRWIRTVAEQLLRDGLLRRRGGRLTLPEE